MTPLNIHYQDDDILVANKPHNLLSVPGKTERNCLQAQVEDYNPNGRLVHRLDRATSGLIVFALNHPAQVHLQRQFAARSTEKRYVAVVDGLVEQDQGLIDEPLVCDWPNRPLQKVCYAHGKSAQTRYQVLKRCPLSRQTRVALHPITGRSHQLRVHLLHLGHPMLGDEFYAPPVVLAKAPRLLLHAESLVISHPRSEARLHFTAPAPF